MAWSFHGPIFLFFLSFWGGERNGKFDAAATLRSGNFYFIFFSSFFEIRMQYGINF